MKRSAEEYRDLDLLPHHARMLAESAIASEVAKARSYRSVETKAEFIRLGFSDRQCRVPALLIPIRDMTGEIALYQIRPDAPRIKKGKAIKYESLIGRRMVLDVPTAAGERLRDPSCPLWITEGAKKVDSATSVGLCCIGLLGVWNWRGTNEHGGLTALPDWEGIALKGSDGTKRRIYIAFDSDAVTKRGVHQALERLKAFLESRGAEVWIVYLPGETRADKTGLDDYLAAGHCVDDLLALATRELRPLPRSPDDDRVAEAYPYRERADGIYLVKQAGEEEYEHKLTNFRARITSDMARDDGLETRRALEIEATLMGRSKRIVLPASRFPGMNWPVDELGAGAVVSAGMGSKDHARAAIQLLSGEVGTRHVYTHTGWRKIDDEWAYLHAGGAIGPNGSVSGVDVDLPRELALLTLPGPPEGADLRRAIRASLALVDVAPDRIIFPLLAAVFRAPLGVVDFSLFLAGSSGTGKSELAALAAQHYGPGLTRLKLVSWASTGNALEGLAFHAKDALFVTDDFAPTGTPFDVARMHREADRFLRAQGNNSGRTRMAPDGTVRGTRSPRGLTLSTGEDVPRGQSLRARMLVLDVDEGDVDWRALTQAQRHGAEGLYAQTLAAYVQWLAANRDQHVRLARQVGERLRDMAHQSRWHRRMASLAGALGAGFRCFLRFACQAGAITREDRKRLWTRAWKALGNAIARQVEHVGTADPASRFLELLVSAVASGEAHFASLGGSWPTQPDGLGWRRRTYGPKDGDFEWVPLGKRVGWIDGDDLFLDLDAAHKAAQVAAGPAGDGVVVAAQTLAKRLHEKGLLVSVDEKRGRLRVRHTLEQKRRSVLHISASSLFTADEPAQAAHSEESGGSGAGNPGPVAGSVLPLQEKPTQETAHETPASDGKGGPVGPNGPVSNTRACGPSYHDTDPEVFRKDRRRKSAGPTPLLDATDRASPQADANGGGARELLSAFTAQGVDLRLDGDGIRCRIPRWERWKDVADELRDRRREIREELIRSPAMGRMKAGSFPTDVQGFEEVTL